MTHPVSIGRMVSYRLSQKNADDINKRRIDAITHMQDHRDNSNGVIVHYGNRVAAGQPFPMIITAVHSVSAGLVNGHVILDGNDSLWAISVFEDVTGLEGPGSWSWPIFIPESVLS
jgi:hypothetical protein